MTRTTFAVEFDPSVVVTPEQIAAWEAKRLVLTGARPVARPQGLIYFMLCGSFVKIGWATDPTGRKKALQTGNPYDIKILATMPGDQGYEKDLHRLFKSCHHRGEWFVYGHELTRFLTNLKNRKVRT